MKKIWIINYYTAPPEFVSNSRHIEFANNLMNAGYEVIIFSSGFLADKNIDLVPEQKSYTLKEYGSLKFVHIKVKHYAGNGLNRMISIFQFAYRLFRNRNTFFKPDIILHNIHAPFDYPISWCAKKLKAKYIVEAWDLWPDSFVRFGLIKKNNPIVKVAYYIEQLFYEKADKIIFSFEGGIDYLNDKHLTKTYGGKINPNNVFYINNGVNLRDFKINALKSYEFDPDLENKNYFNVIYLGSIRLVNDLKKLIEAAELLKSDDKFKFLIYGDGVDRPLLEEYCKERSIDNVIFKEKWIPLSKVPYVLSKSSLNILNYQKQFGIYGISSGKFFQYLASGKPILCNIALNYCLITKYNLGIAEDLNTSKEYAEAIKFLGNLDPDSYIKMCERVSLAASEFDFNVLSKKLITAIES